MTGVEDIHDVTADMKRATSRLENAEISEVNKQLIKRFILSLRRENLKKITVLNYLNLSTRLCQRLHELGVDTPLNEITQYDFDIFLIYMEDERGLAPSGLKLYKVFYKKFTKTMCQDQPKWVREMKVPRDAGRIQPSDLPAKPEFDIIMDCCHTPRNKAFVALLVDGGFRIGALLSCQVKSVTHGKYGAMIYLNPEGSNKTTKAKGIPLTWSTGYLNQWLAVHPYTDNPEAPLFTSTRLTSATQTYEAWAYVAAYNMVKRLQKTTGINKRLFPHLFRHKAITDRILDGLTEQQIKHWAGWTPESGQLTRYGNWTDQEMTDSIYEHYGLKKEDTRQVTLKQCPRCHNVLKADDRFCSQCSLVLDSKAFEVIQEQKNNMLQLLSVAMRDPDFQKRLIEISENKEGK